MGPSLHCEGLNESTKTANLIERIGSLGVAEPVFNSWESIATLSVTRVWRKGGGEVEFDIFGAVSKEDGVDRVKIRGHASHIEPLGNTEVVDTLGEGLAAFRIRVCWIFTFAIAHLELAPKYRKLATTLLSEQTLTGLLQSPAPVG